MIQPLPDDAGALVVDHGDDTARSLDLAALQRAFLRLASALAPKQRAIFVLREIEGLSTPEIARSMGVTESTVRNHLFQARKILRAGIERDYPDLIPGGRRRGGGDS